MGATCGAGTAYPSGAPEFTPGFSGVFVARSLVFCEMFYRSFFVLVSFFFWPINSMSQLFVTNKSVNNTQRIHTMHTTSKQGDYT